MRDASRIERLKNLHDLPVRLLHGPSGPSAGVSSQPPSQLPEGPQMPDRHITACPDKGRSDVRRTGTVMSVYRDLGVSADTAATSARAAGRLGLRPLYLPCHTIAGTGYPRAPRAGRCAAHHCVFSYARSPCLTLTTIAPARCARAAHVIPDRRAGTSGPAPDTGSPSSRATSS